MKVTTVSFEFDGRDEQEVINVTKMLKELLSGASDDVSVETRIVAPKKEEKPVDVSKTTSTAVPAFSEPTQTAAPVQEVKEEPKQEPKQETITEAIAEVKKEIKKFGEPEKVAKPKTVKEAPQATIEPEPVQAPLEEEKAPEKASNEPLTAKDMQAFMMDLMKTGKITRPQLTDIMLEFGGASLMSIKPEKFELLKLRIETYND